LFKINDIRTLLAVIVLLKCAITKATKVKLGGCPRIAIVARARLVEQDFSII
jgi:hypothetical protein